VNNRLLRFSLRNKLVIGFALLSFFVAALTARGFYTNLLNQVQNEFSQRALSIVKVAALQQNGNEFVQISSAEDELYEKFRIQNLKIRYADPDVIYVYTMRKDERGIYFVVDAGEPGEEGIAPFGIIYEEPGPTLADNFDNIDHAIVEPEIYTDEWGSFLSAYAPIYDDDGQKVGVIAVDILADTILAKQKQVFVQSLVILVVATLAGTSFGFVTGHYITKPIQILAARAKDIASGDFEVRVSITTRDEIEELGHAFNDMAAQLQRLVTGLETRVEERTTELEESTKQLQKRAVQFETIAQLARTITSIQDQEVLLNKITQLVSVSFGFYHVGLFLLDESRQYAVLSAANSEGGQRMLDRKHRLGVGQTGIVGYVTSTGNPRVALDTGTDAVFFDNPDLPETRSEMALPLRVGATVVGALDVQSTEANAFSEDDVEVLSILADVVSVAIENARLFEESQRVLTEAQTAFGEFTQDAWRKLSRSRETVGYRLSGTTIRPLKEPAKGNGSSIAVPIKLRDRVIGTMNISLPENKELEPDEVDITESIAQRVGIAIESATLLEESQKAATKEQVIGEITGKIGSSVNLRNVLQTAVEELGKNIPGSEIVIELKSNQEKLQGITSGE